MVGLSKICVNMDEEKAEKNRGKRRGEVGKKREREREKKKSTDIGSVGGSHKQLKNIE